MAKLEVKPFDFDARMVEWNIKHNLITKDQLKAYLGTLPDEASNVETLTIEEEAGSEGDGSNGSTDI